MAHSLCKSGGPRAGFIRPSAPPSAPSLHTHKDSFQSHRCTPMKCIKSPLNGISCGMFEYMLFFSLYRILPASFHSFRSAEERRSFPAILAHTQRHFCVAFLLKPIENSFGSEISDFCAALRFVCHNIYIYVLCVCVCICSMFPLYGAFASTFFIEIFLFIRPVCQFIEIMLCSTPICLAHLSFVPYFSASSFLCLTLCLYVCVCDSPSADKREHDDLCRCSFSRKVFPSLARPFFPPPFTKPFL